MFVTLYNDDQNKIWCVMAASASCPFVSCDLLNVMYSDIHRQLVDVGETKKNEGIPHANTHTGNNSSPYFYSHSLIPYQKIINLFT